MNRVGHAGKGESVWLGWFLHTVSGNLRGWPTHAGSTSAPSVATPCQRAQSALEREAWDGDWYRRAYFDDGTPLGSATNAECRIDSIAQSWGVISGAAEPARGARAMAAVEEYLVRRGDGLVLLFTPPFDRLDPGPRLHQRVSTRRPGKRWSIHPCGHLGRPGVRRARRRRQGRRALLDLESRSITPVRGRRPPLQSRALCCCRRRLCRAAARRSWRMDLVHRVSRVDVPGRHRMDPGVPFTGSKVISDPCIPRTWRSFGIAFRYHSSRYDIVVENP